MLRATAPVNAAYARTSGYSYRHVIGNLSPVPNTANFNRYYLLRQEIESGVHDWALWLDADAIVVDHSVRLEPIIDRNPEVMLIACRGGMQGQHDVNNGVFLLNLQHALAREMIETCIRYSESLEPGNLTFHCDQRIVHQWLLKWQNEQSRADAVRCYAGHDYNLFNYDGPFVRHVLRAFGPFDERVRELHRLANEVRCHMNRTVDAALDAGPRLCVTTRRRENSFGEDSMSFQTERGILVCSPAAYHRPPPSSRWLMESCRRYGIDLTLLGQGQPYPHNRRKVELVAEQLVERPECRYVLMVDFRDVIFCATLREIFHKYKSFGHDIVISAERCNSPVPILGGRSPETGTSYRFLNAGSIFSTSKAWRAAWEKMVERERELGGQEVENPDGRNIFNSDQAAWIDLYVHRNADIVLDAECRLFQTLAGVDKDVGRTNRDLLFEGRRVVNRETGGRPCLLHGCGNAPLTPWARYVLAPPPVWIWPRIDRIRRMPLKSLRGTSVVEQLLLELGLDDPTDGSLPDDVLPYTGKGLCIRQWPNQFARYLTWLAKRSNIQSYLEIGAEQGGSFITTVEYLRRFHPLAQAIGVAPWLTAPVRDYVARTGGVCFVQGTRSSDELRRRVESAAHIDLTFIHGEQSHEGVRADWEFARRRSRYVVFHHVACAGRPEVRSLWAHIRSTYRRTYEFVEQYRLPKSWGGLGVVDVAKGTR